MKNVLVIDGAMNCAYDVYAASDEEFALMFPGEKQDVAFIDEIIAEPNSAIEQALANLWARPVDKKQANGIHGTIFSDLEHKKEFYPNRRDSDLTANRSRPAT